MVTLDVITGRHVLQAAGGRRIEAEPAGLVEEGKPLVHVRRPIGLGVRGIGVLDEPPVKLDLGVVPGWRRADPDFAQRPKMGALVGLLVVLVDKAPLEGLGRGDEIVGKGEAGPLAGKGQGNGPQLLVGLPAGRAGPSGERAFSTVMVRSRSATRRSPATAGT